MAPCLPQERCNRTQRTPSVTLLGYSDYSIGFDAPSPFSFTHGNRFDKNVMTFDLGNGSLIHINDKKQYKYQFLEKVGQID